MAKFSQSMRLGVVVISLVLLTLSAASSAQIIRNYAIVQDDGSLRVQGRTIRLFGVHIFLNDRQCTTQFRPIQCGSEANLALKRRIQGFVSCYPKSRYGNRALSAVCYVEQGSINDPPLDLGAWLIEKGLAVANQEAPFHYVTLERIAQTNGRGIWRRDYVDHFD